MAKGTSAVQKTEISLEKEADLIRRAAVGEAQAFAQLYDAHVDDLYRFIFYRVSDQQTAEDLTSQLFIKAWDNLGRYESRGVRFSAWLYQIARNMVIDHYRTRKETVALEPIATMKPDPAANVSKYIERKLEGEWVRSMLEHLTDDQREVLTLKFINGLSTKEVATVMKKKQGAIRALQMRALQALAKLMEGNSP